MKLAHPKYDLEFWFSSFPERYLAEWYQWEFLRRNSEYRVDHEKFQADHRGWLRRNGYWYDDEKRRKWTKAVTRSFEAKIVPDILRICEKWQIGDLYPPEWEF